MSPVNAPRLSIVIPAYNEENYLPRLLKSIRAQNYPGLHEVVVADAESTDATKMIAKAFGCKVVNARRGTPSLARNSGASAASGELILFLDADVTLPRNFIKDSVWDFQRRKLDIAGTHVRPLSKNLFDILIIDVVANSWIWLMQFLSPDAIGACILVKKEVHERVKGFDESVYFGEDMAYVKGAVKRGYKFGVLKTKIGLSMRRFEKGGRLLTTLKYLFLQAKRFFVKITNSTEYPFEGY